MSFAELQDARWINKTQVIDTLKEYVYSGTPINSKIVREVISRVKQELSQGDRTEIRRLAKVGAKNCPCSHEADQYEEIHDWI